jgi:hypothetical protein
MVQGNDAPTTTVSIGRSYDYELQLVREAVAMVASGRTPRVVLGGIRYPEAVLDTARRVALAAGVRLITVPRADDQGVDISIQRVFK